LLLYSYIPYNQSSCKSFKERKQRWLEEEEEDNGEVKKCSTDSFPWIAIQTFVGERWDFKIKKTAELVLKTKDFPQDADHVDSVSHFHIAANVVRDNLQKFLSAV